MARSKENVLLYELLSCCLLMLLHRDTGFEYLISKWMGFVEFLNRKWMRFYSSVDFYYQFN